MEFTMICLYYYHAGAADSAWAIFLQGGLERGSRRSTRNIWVFCFYFLQRRKDLWISRESPSMVLWRSIFFSGFRTNLFQFRPTNSESKWFSLLICPLNKYEVQFFFTLRSDFPMGYFIFLPIIFTIAQISLQASIFHDDRCYDTLAKKMY